MASVDCFNMNSCLNSIISLSIELNNLDSTLDGGNFKETVLFIHYDR